MRTEMLGEGAPELPLYKHRHGPRVWWFAILILFVLVALSGYRQGWFTPTTRVNVILPGAAGLAIGTPVRLRGFPIGEIDAIELQNDLTVKARLRIQSDRFILLSNDTVAKVGRDTPVANKHIDLLPNMNEKVRMSPGQDVKLAEGQEIEDILATAKGLMDQLKTTLGRVEPILAKVEPILGNVNTVTQQLAETMPTLRANIESVARNVDQSTSNVRQTTASANALVQDLLAQKGPVLTELQTILENTKQSTAKVNLLLRDLAQEIPAAAQSGRAVADDAAEITQGLKNSWPFSALLNAQGQTPSPLDSFEGVAP